MKTNKRLFIIYYYTEFSSHVLVSHLKFVSQILSMTCSLSYESVSHVCLTYMSLIRCMSHINNLSLIHCTDVPHICLFLTYTIHMSLIHCMSHILVSHSLFVSHICLSFTVCLPYLSLIHFRPHISVSHSWSVSHICLSFVACFTYVCLINRLSHRCVSYSLSVSNICLSFTVIFTLHENKYEHVSFCSLSHKSVSHFHFVSNVSLLFARIGHNLE